jgi:pimeloyl-ACP methyl ester carboxylesterase
MIVGAGYSFDWDVVQQQASHDTRVCTYDPAGSAWSDPPVKAPTCDTHIEELHQLMVPAGIADRVVLVGQSIGAVFARLYADRYPKEVAGMVIVDHAAVIQMSAPPVGARGTPIVGNGAVLGRGVRLPPGTVLPGSAGAEVISQANGEAMLQRLPARERALHAWADSLPSSRSPRAQRALFDRCMAEIDSTDNDRSKPLGSMPLAVVSLPLTDPGYRSLQARLLGLSTNSKGIVADSSGHLIQVERPDLVARAIESVVVAARRHTRVSPAKR